MKFNHTNAMKDNDKPEAPEGYTVMLGKDIRTETPGFMWLFSCEEWKYWTREECGPVQVDWWYAVPVSPNTDPKASQAIQKPQLQLIPAVLNDETAKALSRGAEKYGPWNWRENRVEMMTYLGAMKRHIDQLIEGEDIDPDTGAHHLGCVAAGCGIVLDARKHGTLVDNRPPKGQEYAMKDIRFKPEASNPKPIIHFPEWGADQEKPQVTGAFDDEDEQGMRDMHGQDS